jgi:hypothetical protein
MARKTGAALLHALLDSERLTEDEDRAFRGMLNRIEGMPYKLTERQRVWAEEVYERLDLAAEDGSENLISSGAYVPTAKELARKFPWENMPKPRKPPGRSCPEGVGPCKCCDPCKVHK